MNSSNLDLFGIYCNLAICLFVVLFGTRWLWKDFKKPSGFFRKTAFQFWWLGWLAWSIAWLLVLIKFTQLEGSEISQQKTKTILQATILIFDNLNTIFFLCMYLVLTRGEEYIKKNLKYDFYQLSFFFSIVIPMLYILCKIHQKSDFAIILHNTFSLSLGIIAPILLGWAYNLRFNTKIIFYIGIAYGLMQPLVYVVNLNIQNGSGFDVLKDYKPVIDAILAFLKIALAVTSIKILYSDQAFVKSLIHPVINRKSEFSSGWNSELKIFTSFLFLLLFGMIVYLIAIYIDMKKIDPSFMGAMSSVLSIGGLFYTIGFQIIERMRHKKN